MRPRTYRTAALAAAALLSLAACGDSGQSGTQPQAGASSGSGTVCAGVAGDQLVALTDDKKLQTADNVIPAVNARTNAAGLIDNLDKVSAVLTTDDLVALNKSTDIDRKTPANVAKDFVTSKNLTTGLTNGSGKVVVGAANFSENQTLANIYADVLNAAGFSATVQTVGNRELYLPALEKGGLTVVPEYAGTLTEFINKKVNGPNASPMASGDLDATVQALTSLGDKVGLKFGKPAEAADQNTFAVTKAFADKYSVKSLSDLAAKCGGGVTLGGPPECPQRPFCQPGLQSKYGLKFTSFKSLDAGGPLTKTALKQGQVALGLVFSSDAALASG
jgi:osmoprotectant transport system substrate-binding protein